MNPRTIYQAGTDDNEDSETSRQLKKL